MATCPNCGNKVGENAIFCDQCGSRLPQAEVAAPAPAPAAESVICPVCGAGNVPGEAFCDTCGSPLASPVPTSQPAQEAPAGAAAVVPSVPAGPTPAQPAVPDQPACPSCGTVVMAGEAFCANCGASLVKGPIAPEPVPDVVPPPPGPEPVLPSTPPPPESQPPAAPQESAYSPPVDVTTPPAEVTPVAMMVPPPAPEPEQKPAEAPAPAPVPAARCPVCGAPAAPDDTFCSTCGAALKAGPAPVAQPPAAAPAAVPSAPAGALSGAGGARLVVDASGAEIPLPSGNELLIGREDPVSGIFPDVDMTPHGGEDGGVSRRHARLLFDNGQYSIEDLDSTNFTFVNKQKLAPRTRQPLRDGDEIRLGRVGVVLRLS